MQVSIWYVVTLYVLGAFAVASYEYDKKPEMGTLLAVILWPVITAITIVVRVFKN